MIGRRGAGKTTYVARLYEALWKGCDLVEGRMLQPGESKAGREVQRISCKATSGSTHAELMRELEELRAGRWLGPTSTNRYAEIVVDFDGRERTLMALDCPGEVFQRAFMNDSQDSASLELLSTIDRAAAVIFLIDPSVVASGGAASHEDTFGLAQAAERIRSSPGGSRVPVAIVFTKCDLHVALFKEAGGVRAFAQKHFAQMFKSVERSNIFASAAVRTLRTERGKTMPCLDKAAENVVEPLRYCLEAIDALDEEERKRARGRARAAAASKALAAERSARTRSVIGWTAFVIFVLALLATVAYLTVTRVSGV